MALAGGVSVSVPGKSGRLYEEGMIFSPDGHCRAFDEQAAGTIAGNGCGVVALARLEDALEEGDHIYVVIRGSAINNDGAVKVGCTAPGAVGQADVVAETLSVADVDPATVTYVETQGTGAALGDPVEIEALTRAFGVREKEGCAIGSVKTNIGHLNSAAGLIKTVLSLHHRQIPPSLNHKRPNPGIDFENSPFFVNTTLRRWELRGAPQRSTVSSFGIVGANAHMGHEEFPDDAPPRRGETTWEQVAYSHLHRKGGGPAYFARRF